MTHDLKTLACCTLMALLAGTSVSHGGPPPAGPDSTDSIESLRADLEALRLHTESLEQRNEALGASLETQNRDWLNAERAAEIRGIVQDVLADSQSRTSLQDSGMMAGYKPGRGFYIGNQDGSFSLQITGQIQTRWVLNYTKQSFADRGTNTENSPKTTWGFQIRRAKVKFKGNVIDKSWKYAINGAFGSDGIFDFEEVMLSKVFENGITMTLGQFKTPWLREEIVSSSRQLAVERSVVNEFFNQDRAVGLFVAWKNDDWSLAGSYNNGQRTLLNADERYTNFLDNPTKWAFSARAEYKLSGEWSDFKGFNGGIDQDQAVMIGVAFMGQQYNDQVIDGSIPGAPTIPVEYDNSTVWGVTADISAKFQNISLFAAGVFQSYDTKGSEKSQGFDLFDLSEYAPWGFVVQGGWSVNDEWELFARYENGNVPIEDLKVAGAPLDTRGGVASILTVGANWFLNSKVKFTADWGINFADDLNTFDDPGDGWRDSATSDEWVLRAQLQLLF
ncbi:MAG: porin [Planctomycetota bacterium]|nr:porin [Planctomycetota bacterium]